MPATAIRYRLAFTWGCGVALAMSTQLLFQPFVWRNFEWDEIADGWLALLLQRAAVALPIAGAIALASRGPTASLRARATLLGVAILGGALVGELLRAAFDPSTVRISARAVSMRAAPWCLLASSIASLFYLWRHGETARAEAQGVELRRLRIEREVVRTRLQALRSQIEPHFLFNTLATLRRLHHTEPGEGSRLLAHFLDYLRSALPDHPEGQGTLGQELDLVRAYLQVVAVRMDGRLQLEFDVPVALRGAEFPALTLATLVENAIKHGITPATDGGAVRVRARRAGALLEVEVADTGVGFNGSTSGGTGMGLANISSRLATLYGTHGALTLAANKPCGVRATIRLPWADGSSGVRGESAFPVTSPRRGR